MLRTLAAFTFDPVIMVALNEQFALKNPAPGQKNRVGNFFGQDGKSSRANRLPRQNPRRENGHGYDETASGMFYYGFRYYDPVTGRWPSRDPSQEAGGFNLYAMSGNNLIDQIDLYGLWSEQAWSKRNWSANVRNPGSFGESFIVNAKHFSALQQRWGLLFLSWPAFSLLSHYLDDDGSEQSVDISEILEDDDQARRFIRLKIDQAIGFADGLDLSSGDKDISDRINVPYETLKWVWALGAGGSSWEGDANVSLKGGCVVLSLKYHLWDPWDFEYDDDAFAGLGISDYDLRRMHDFGYASEFLVFSTSNTVEIKWKQGDSDLPKGRDYVSDL